MCPAAKPVITRQITSLKVENALNGGDGDYNTCRVGVDNSKPKDGWVLPHWVENQSALHTMLVWLDVEFYTKAINRVFS